MEQETLHEDDVELVVDLQCRLPRLVVDPLEELEQVIDKVLVPHTPLVDRKHELEYVHRTGHHLLPL